MTTAVPPYLKPKATKLPAGHDDTLDPPVPPTDAEERSAPPTSWPRVDTSKGSDRPPDPPAAPPAVPPMVRSVPPFEWPASPVPPSPGRAVHLAIPVPDIDPDIAFWPVTTLQRWPFTGPPAEGIWPKGWAGIDNTATLYICTVAGSPGTWAALAFAGAPDTGWINLTLDSGWSVEGGGQARYRKANGIVYLELTVAQTAASLPVATLPAGFRPNGTFGLNFPIAAANSGVYAAGYGFVLPNGQIQVNNNDGSLPNFAAVVLSFPADQ